MPPRQLALSFIFLTALIDSIGFGILMPVLPSLYMEITGEGLAQAAIYGGWLMFAYASMQFFFAPVLGNLSDAYGKPFCTLLSRRTFHPRCLLGAAEYFSVRPSHRRGQITRTRNLTYLL